MSEPAKRDHHSPGLRLGGQGDHLNLLLPSSKVGRAGPSSIGHQV